MDQEVSSPRRDIIEDVIAILLDARDLLAIEARTEDDRARSRESMRRRRRAALVRHTPRDTKRTA